MKTMLYGTEVTVLPLTGKEPFGTELALDYDGQILYYKSIGNNKSSIYKFYSWIPEISKWTPTTIDVSNLL